MGIFVEHVIIRIVIEGISNYLYQAVVVSTVDICPMEKENNSVVKISKR